MRQWNPQANEIFLQALEIPSSEQRRACVENACGDDADLRDQVESLLLASQEAGSFLESPAAELGPDTAGWHVEERPGAMIGRYKLLQQIGEGGFGVVFMAEQQEPVRRKVALKIIKPGMDSKQVIARFEVEEQTLALMDHPNIARVLDAGTTDSGRPYFVMELVKGVPITEYCQKNSLPPRERLDVFRAICDAVQHAHQKGIIHRDIKPGNVLVALRDGVPTVKVIDFGVSKALNQRLTEKTLFTHLSQMVGTPLYMSPEQAEMSGLDVDTRSDIYSLGVTLYELLTGTTPFDKQRLQEAAYDEVRRIIREEDPPKPSVRMSTLGGGETAPAEAQVNRSKNLVSFLEGDLDWIVMKALEKDRGRRYETAKDFAADVARYLNDEPVEASPPSTTYRLRKYIRRHRGLFAAASLILLALVAGTGVSVWQAIRASRAEQRVSAALLEANRCRKQAEEALWHLQRTRSHAMSGAGSLLNLMKDYDKAKTQFERALALDPDNALANNNYAWFLATCPDPAYRDTEHARSLALKATLSVPESGLFWNTLGVAEYREGNWTAAMDALNRSQQLLGQEYVSHNAFFQSMACWQLQHEDDARKHFDRAVAWMEKNNPTEEDLLRFCAETAELLGSSPASSPPNEDMGDHAESL